MNKFDKIIDYIQSEEAARDKASALILADILSLDVMQDEPYKEQTDTRDGPVHARVFFRNQLRVELRKQLQDYFMGNGGDK